MIDINTVAISGRVDSLNLLTDKGYAFIKIKSVMNKRGRDGKSEAITYCFETIIGKDKLAEQDIKAGDFVVIQGYLTSKEIFREENGKNYNFMGMTIQTIVKHAGIPKTNNVSDSFPADEEMPF